MCCKMKILVVVLDVVNIVRIIKIFGSLRFLKMEEVLLAQVHYVKTVGQNCCQN